MMKTILVCILLIFTSCSIKYKQPDKPFVIERKFSFENVRQRESNPGKCWYTYISADGQRVQFVDYDNKYSVGDVIE